MLVTRKGARPWLGAAAVILLVVGGCSANTVKVSGDSMAPALKDGDIKLVDTSAYSSSSPKRGDIVQFHHNQIGRVIGLPGEKVTIADGKVSINGSVLSEPYLATGTQTTAPQDTYLVPSGQYFILKDNRPRAADSRTLGFIPKSDIQGKVT